MCALLNKTSHNIFWYADVTAILLRGKGVTNLNITSSNDRSNHSPQNLHTVSKSAYRNGHIYNIFGYLSRNDLKYQYTYNNIRDKPEILTTWGKKYRN